jgi:hypothetical protein
MQTTNHVTFDSDETLDNGVRSQMAHGQLAMWQSASPNKCVAVVPQIDHSLPLQGSAECDPPDQ